jgi:hypothetical protein
MKLDVDGSVMAICGIIESKVSRAKQMGKSKQFTVINIWES